MTRTDAHITETDDTSRAESGAREQPVAITSPWTIIAPPVAPLNGGRRAEGTERDRR